MTGVPPDPREVVARGYDQVSYAYQDDRGTAGAELRRPWVQRLAALTPAGGRILDLGCGAGVPVARDLAGAFEVTGVDISPVQVRRARVLVPAATFVRGDMTAVDFAAGSFDSVVCLYALIHVPLERQRDLLGRIARWLVPGGHLLMTVGETAWSGTQRDWLGVSDATMFWSHADWQTYQAWLDELRFHIVADGFVAEGDGGHHFVLASSTPTVT